ncbi:MAG: hypothetical protein V7K48_21300 [Nostoc sp.]|uniref:hypothetical protein n=1 Tax=Nostoc sp. TaxID=1180 RepID=UPI002FF61A59
MNNIQKIINGSDSDQVISVNYTYSNLGTILITFLLLLTAISMQSAAAVDSVVSENREAQLRVFGLNSQPNISLRQRLPASKKNNAVAELDTISISHGLIANVKPETFSHSIVIDNLCLESQNCLATNDKFDKQLFTYKISNTDLHLKEHTNILQQKQSQIIVQTDSSDTVGDTFGETNKLRQELLIDPIVTVGVSTKAAPGSTAGTPSAYGASFGQAYIGGGLLTPIVKHKDREDGSLSLGFGLGNAAKSVGLEVNVNITSVGGGDSFDFGDSGGVGFKLHKYLGDGTAVAIGWSNPIKWGDVRKAKDTIYGVVTKSFLLQPDNQNNKLPLTVSVGLGSGAFRSKGALEADENTVNLFASLGLRVIPEVSLVSSWTGNRLNIGASFAPLKKTPIVINTIFTNVTDNIDTGLGFALSAGYSFQF